MFDLSINMEKMAVAFINSTIISNPPPIPDGKRYVRIHDPEIRGFFVEFRPSPAGGGRIRGTYWLRYNDNRRRERYIRLGSIGDAPVAAVRKRARELRAMVALGGDPAREADLRRAVPTVASFLTERLLPFLAERQRGAANHRAYARRIIAAIGQKHLDEVTPGDIDNIRRSLQGAGLASGTVNRHQAFLRMAFNRAIRWGMFPGPNPAASLLVLEERHRNTYLTIEQTRALVRALELEPDFEAAQAIRLLLLTGARVSEIVLAEWSWVDLDRSILVVPRAKSGKPRTIVLSPLAMAVLRVQLGRRQSDCRFIFPGRRPERPVGSLRYAFARAKKLAALPQGFVLHGLRHSFASSLASQGVPLSEIGLLLGHTQLETTRRYAHLYPQRLIETASRAVEPWLSSTMPASHGAQNHDL